MTQQTAYPMTEAKPFVAHATFSIQRLYPQSPARVFAAHADIAIKRRWLAEGEGFEVLDYAVDFRLDGRETCRFNYQGGPEMIMETVFQDIVPDRRIVFAYRMAIGGAPLSASLATVELVPEGTGTRLTYTEQGAYFDSEDSLKGREEGSRGLLERLAEVLDEEG
jgi:uncharacterized protein YndB with AHSA1/START domain